MTPAEIRSFIAQSEWFHDLPPPALEQLALLAVPRQLDDGALLFAKGDAADGLYGLISGRIRISATTADGRDLVVQLFEPGSWFGEISMFDGLPRTHNACAIGASTLLLIPRARFHALLAGHPALYPHFMRLLCGKLRRSFAWIEYAAFLPMPARIAARLLELARDYGETQADGAVLIKLHLPQEELGHMLSTSRQTISKELRAFESRGWIGLDYGRILIRDPDALAALVGVAA
ncbi:Crp/Fnr family transcriptional regulator [Solimonas variicoloris]|uniref:Crp/Fnr family transcriptional regulator n=1 Tax=Solimonas variicoloris TaxID=254408 RepID=UPI000360D345|nr:Crp/Fnr family transcriptional regulator [Solimonas variicoloris]